MEKSLPIKQGSSFATAWMSDLMELTKARLTFLVLVTTFVGFYLGSGVPLDWRGLFHAMLGTTLLAAGASALNQLLEREADAKMHRTQGRPLPAGRMGPDEVLILGFVSALSGLIYLGVCLNLVSAMIGALTLGTYLFVYTPLKRVTTLNTVVGAVPGALPPVLGWVAVRGSAGIEAWTLFAILFFWQIPHFMAIAWMHREDYARGGFCMLSQNDPEGRATSRQALVYAMALVPVSLLPVMLGMCGNFYFVSALVLSSAFAFLAWKFLREPTILRARHLFWGSITYLPLLLAAMVVGKL